MRNNFDTFTGVNLPFGLIGNETESPAILFMFHVHYAHIIPPKYFLVRTWSVFIGFLILLASCSNSGGKEGDCPTSPNAIFSEDLVGVDSHDFMQTGTEGLEIVAFSNGVFLEIFQSGCDSLRQEFRFRFPDPMEEESPEFWFQEAQNQFRTLGSLGPTYAPFSQYADAMALQGDVFRLTQPMEVETGFWMQVDKIQSFDGPTLIVVLANYEL